MTAPAAAGFWRRYAAWSLDATLLAAAALAATWPLLAGAGARIVAAWLALVQAGADRLVEALLAGRPLPAFALQAGADPQLHAATGALLGALAGGLLPPLAAFAALGLLYHAGFEASALRATPGKRALGLRVARGDADLGPHWARALARQAAGALSWLSLNLGHALAALPPQRRALHDRVAGTRVLQAVPGDASLPAWAWLWIAAQLALAAAITLWLFAAMQRDLQQALDRALSAT